MAIYQKNEVTSSTWVLAQLESLLPDETWVGAAVTRAAGMIKLYESSQIDGQALAFNLVNIKKLTQEHITYEDALRKNKLDDLLNPLIDKLKGA